MRIKTTLSVTSIKEEREVLSLSKQALHRQLHSHRKDGLKRSPLRIEKRSTITNVVIGKARQVYQSSGVGNHWASG